MIWWDLAVALGWAYLGWLARGWWVRRQHRRAFPGGCAGTRVCLCGHDDTEHFRETGACLHSTEELLWACACAEFTPSCTEEHA